MANGLIFDPTVNVGQIFEAAAVIAGGLLALTRMIGSVHHVGEAVKRVEEKYAVHSGRLDRIESEMEKQTEILVSLGQQAARLANLEAQMTLIQTRILKDA